MRQCAASLPSPRRAVASEWPIAGDPRPRPQIAAAGGLQGHAVVKNSATLNSLLELHGRRVEPATRRCQRVADGRRSPTSATDRCRRRVAGTGGGEELSHRM